jgi:hypothetical protein
MGMQFGKKWIAVLALAVGMAWALPAAHAEDGKMKLKFELPEPYFGGTPLDYFGENLEEPNYKPRPDFFVPEGTTNVALGKKVTASGEPEFGKLAFLVDGDTSYKQSSLLGLPEGHQWVQIDLGEECDLYALALWHFHEGDRVYFDVAIQVSDDPDFKNAKFVFNNDHDNSSKMGKGTDKEYIESYKGKFIDLKGVKARYIRFYSNGNTSDGFNHYVEAMVFGKPAK